MKKVNLFAVTNMFEIYFVTVLCDFINFFDSIMDNRCFITLSVCIAFEFGLFLPAYVRCDMYYLYYDQMCNDDYYIHVIKKRLKKKRFFYVCK